MAGHHVLVLRGFPEVWLSCRLLLFDHPVVNLVLPFACVLPAVPLWCDLNQIHQFGSFLHDLIDSLFQTLSELLDTAHGERPFTKAFVLQHVYILSWNQTARVASFMLLFLLVREPFLLSQLNPFPL